MSESNTVAAASHETGYALSGSPGAPVRIFYRLFGAPGRTPVLIVHGLSFFSYDWIEPAAPLAADREVAAMDMRGFGDSDWPGDYSIEANATDMVAVLDHLRWPRAILVGHSMGGRHAAVAAVRAPDRFAGLVLVDAAPENAPTGSARVARTVAATPDVFADVDAMMRWSGIDPSSEIGRRRRGRFEAYAKPVEGGVAVKRDAYFRDQFRRQLETGERHKPGVDLWEVLRQLDCPTLVIRGKRSDLFAAETVPKVAAANPRIRIVEVEAGHNVAGDNCEAFARETRAFIASIEA